MNTNELKARNGSRYLVLIEPPGSPSKRFWMIACRWDDGWWNAWDEPGQHSIKNVIGWLDLPPTDTRAPVAGLTVERVGAIRAELFKKHWIDPWDALGNILDEFSALIQAEIGKSTILSTAPTGGDSDKHPRHVCGLTGFGLGLDDSCPACEARKGKPPFTPNED